MTRGFDHSKNEAPFRAEMQRLKMLTWLSLQEVQAPNSFDYVSCLEILYI